MGKTDRRKNTKNSDKIDDRLARKKQRILKIVKQQSISEYDDEEESLYYRKR